MSISPRDALLGRNWPFSTAAPDALLEVGKRVAAVGKREGLIHYSDLVRGVSIRMPQVREGNPFELGVPDWPDLDRAILGDFLGCLSVESYKRAGILASALVTAKTTEEPSEGFWSLVSDLGLLTSSNPNKRMLYWMGEVRRAHEWYAVNAWPPT